MIITPDFLDHWKTRLFTELVGEQDAPCYLIRLWGHCQNRKKYRFEPENLNPMTLKAITNAGINENALWKAFVDSKYIDIYEDGYVEAHGFYDQNKQLCANWESGRKGGRPKKIDKNPSETHLKPKDENEDEKEKTNIMDEIEGKNDVFYPSPRKNAFWYGKDYSSSSVPEVNSYEDIHKIKDPIIACMAVSGDRSKAMYGFIIKGLQKCLDAGLSSETLEEYLIGICIQLFGERKDGERNPEKIPAAFVAILRKYFDTVDKPI